MALSAGSRIGALEIVSPIGAGGMGEVYRARDSKLGRDVALKILPDAFANDPERLARFEREARTLASLNHPNIAQIYGFEQAPATGTGATGFAALVMELVEGEDLSQRIARGPLPLDEALPIVKQIADALEAAHDHGVIHRDLKPANIKLRDDGTVKVLDFGLAKALDAHGGAGETGGIGGKSSGSVLNSPTFASPAMTQRGMILGTAAYMSPEQARGKPVDKRADIWAFGVVTHEMLTGRSLFAGESVSDAIAAVLRAEVDLGTLPAGTPDDVRRLLERCLQRDPRMRLRDIGEARIALEPAALSGTRAPRVARSRRSRLPAFAMFAAGAAIALLAAFAWARWKTPAPTADSALRFRITPADGVALDDPLAFVLSPDGQSILLKGSEDGVAFWYVRSLVDGSVRRLENTKGTTASAFWSPDSKWIAFARGATFHRAAIDDTRPQLIGGHGTQWASWSASGELLFVTASKVMAIPETGGAARVVLDAADGSFWVNPWTLPDGRRFLIQNNAAESEILLATVDGVTKPRFIAKGSQPADVAPGWLLAARGRQLVAWKFDVDTGTIDGEPVVLRGDVTARGTGGRIFSVSQTAIIAIRNEPETASTRVAWFDRAGAQGTALKLNRHCRNVELAPDGRRVALECYEGGSESRDIWIYDLERDAASRFTVDPGDDSDPLWSADGRSLVFGSNRRGPVNLFRKSAGGATPEQLLLETPGATPPMAWSADGRHIAVLSLGVFDLLTLEIGGSSLVPTVIGPSQELELQFSPDGRLFSYSSDDSGRAEIYVQPWPPNGDKWQMSTDGGTDARWGPDSKELFYLSPDRALMAVAIDTSKGFRARAPRRLFETKIAGPLGSGHRFPYAVSRDGKRFLMYVSTLDALPTIDVIVNWPALVQPRTKSASP